MENKTIQEFYTGQNIFITGATGFVGIALVEKLLRCIPEIGKIYLLIRPKKGKDVSERLAEYIKNPIFDRVKEERGNDVLRKLEAITGDVGEENLGINDSDRQFLKDNINIVFHSAATLDFVANLKTAVTVNLLGTCRVIQLCKEIKNLKVLLHVSSAYVNSNLEEAEEKLYPAPERTEKILELLKNLSDKALEDITPTVLGTHVNTYTFTKALAEHEVAESVSSFPSCIVRPSMIVAAWKEPVPGWTISKNGPQGFMMGALKGVIRRLPMNPDLICDYIPVDIVINGMIAGAHQAAMKRTNTTLIYHLTSSTYNPFTWKMVSSEIHRILHRYPLKSAVWYPTIKFIPSIFWFKISALIFHFLPALILDTVTVATGGRPILIKLHRNVNQSLDLLKPFIFCEWKYYNKNMMTLHENMHIKDQQVFGLDIQSLDWIIFFENLVKGVREYLLHEKSSTLSAARKKDSLFWVLNILLQVFLMVCLSFFFSCLIGFSWSKVSFFLPFLYVIFCLL